MKYNNSTKERIDDMRKGGMKFADIAKELNMPLGSINNLYYGDVKPDDKEENSLEQGNDFINVVCSSKRCLSQEDVIKQFGIDLTIWEVVSYRVKTSEGYRKDRSVEWHVKDGSVLQGDVSDTGKMLVVPLYHIEVKLTKKVREARAKDAVDDLINDAKNFSPKYPKINYKKCTDGYLYELGIPDIHFGRLSWEEESGANFDIKIAKQCVASVMDQLLGDVGHYSIVKILLPIGNDFFNSDNLVDTTTRGTPMDEDVRWAKTFRKGREMAVDMIDKCNTIAPVDVMIIPGNHDQQRSFYLGEALSAWYHNNENVNIDNSARIRKYYAFGKNLIGFAHGYSEKLANLPLIMAIDEPKMWAESVHREWHTGDKHHKKDMEFTTADESSGIVVRILRSLAEDDAWTFSKGYKSLKAAESFLWDKDRGLVAQFTATPNIKSNQKEAQ
jgi:hypothetical protein